MGSESVDEKDPVFCISADLICKATSSKKTPMNITQTVLAKAICTPGFPGRNSVVSTPKSKVTIVKMLSGFKALRISADATIRVDGVYSVRVARMVRVTTMCSMISSDPRTI